MLRKWHVYYNKEVDADPKRIYSAFAKLLKASVQDYNGNSVDFVKLVGAIPFI